MRSVGRVPTSARAPRLRSGHQTGLHRAAFAVAVLAAGAWLWPTAVGGGTAFVTTRGASMEPRFHTGDLAVVHAADRYQIGDVVAYRSDQLKSVVMHRIVARDGTTFVFKGDNNSFLDPEHPVRSQLIGKLAVRVPQGGIWLERLTSPAGLGLIAFGLLASGGTAVQTRRRRRGGTMSRHATNRPSRSGAAALATAPPWLRTAAATTAVAGILGLALAALAWTGPVMKLASGQAPTSRSVTFSYTAAVPRTPAYDDTTARSPDPVFRRLTNTVDLHVAYQGSPGTVTVSAGLSTSSGWHSTVPLAAPASFSGNRYESTVRLDLDAFQARAQSAAAVTGLPADPLTVDVVTSVETAGAAPFTPTLRLKLTPLQLTLAGDPKTLMVEDSTAGQQAPAASRTIGALGHHITVATARTLSAILLLAGLLGAAAVALIARRSTPTSEGAGIRRRYASLLVPARPMPTPPGRPVADVTEFAALARLAERYGLLVLHWSRSNVETFVVQDEGTTYRYRTSAGDASNPVTADTFATTGADPSGA
jgi:signal peptidase I